MGNRRTISFVIVITRLDPVSRVAATSGITMLTTPSHVPRAHAIWERFLGSVRRECLDHLFILQQKPLDRVLHASGQSFNQARPHQGIQQQIPEQYGEPALPDHDGGKIHSFPVLARLSPKCLSSDGFAKKRVVPLGKARFIWEVAERQSLFYRFSQLNATSKRYLSFLS